MRSANSKGGKVESRLDLVAVSLGLGQDGAEA